MGNTNNPIPMNDSFSGTDMIATCNIKLDDQNTYSLRLGSLQTLTYSIHMERVPVRSIGNINAKDFIEGPRTIAGTIIFAVFDQHFMYKIFEKVSEKNPSNTERNFLADEMPPFDITITMANEYGVASHLCLFGIRIVNEGQVMSINDIYTENTYQFVATDIEYLNNDTGTAWSSKRSTGGFLIQSTDKGITKITTNVNNSDTKEDVKIVNMAITTKAPSFINKNGSAKIVLFPQQDSGTITISGPQLSHSIAISVAEYKNVIDRAFYINLPTGNYTAVYSDNIKDAAGKTVNKKFCTESFSINKYVTENKIVTFAPTITNVTNNYIEINSNTSQHTKVKCIWTDYSIDDANKDHGPWYKNLEYQKCSLSQNEFADIKENRSYYISTCNDDNTSESLAVFIKTQSDQDYIRTLLKTLVYNNLNILTQEQQVYNDILDSVSDASSTININNSIIDAIINIKKTSTAALAKASAYEQNILTHKIQACLELISIITDYINNRNHVLNQNTAVIDPPVPATPDVLDNIILTDPKTVYLEFYRINGNSWQFIVKVLSYNFKEHASGKLACKFNGKSGARYIVHAVNGDNVKSANLEFYVMTDEERQKAIIIKNQENGTIEQIKRLSESELLYLLQDKKISNDNSERLIMQRAKNTFSVSLLYTPTVTKCDLDGIQININNDNLIYDDTYNLTISDKNSLMRNTPKYKISFMKNEQNTNYPVIVLPTIEYNLKHNETYYFWIENSSGIQISDCQLIIFDELDNDDNTELKDFNLDVALDNIKDYLMANNQFDENIQNAFLSIKDDNTITEQSLYENILSYLLLLTPQRSQKMNYVKMFYKIKTDLGKHINNELIQGPITINKSQYTITMPEDYMNHILYMIYIDDKTGTLEKETIKLDNRIISISNDKRDKIIEFNIIDTDLLQQSGFIAIDFLSDSLFSYRIATEVKK